MAYHKDENAIFTNEIGLRITPMAATCAFQRIATAAGASTTRLHDARHTAASHLLVAGADIRTVASILGHSSPTTTLNLYSHLLAEAQRDAIDRLGNSLETIAAKPASTPAF